MIEFRKLEKYGEEFQGTLLAMQSKHLSDIKKLGKIWEFSYLKLEESEDKRPKPFPGLNSIQM